MIYNDMITYFMSSLSSSSFWFSIVAAWTGGENTGGLSPSEYLNAQSGNMAFYKCAEGFLESFPQAIFQLAVFMRTMGEHEGEDGKYEGRNNFVIILSLQLQMVAPKPFYTLQQF